MAIVFSPGAATSLARIIFQENAPLCSALESSHMLFSRPLSKPGFCCARLYGRQTRSASSVIRMALSVCIMIISVYFCLVL